MVSTAYTPATINSGNYSKSVGGSDFFLFLEDNASFLLLEDDSSKLILESSDRSTVNYTGTSTNSTGYTKQ